MMRYTRPMHLKYMYVYIYLESLYIESTGKIKQNSYLGLEHISSDITEQILKDW
jgi:hypothetical protein